MNSKLIQSSILGFALAVSAGKSCASTLRVPTDYPTIQGALNAAADADVVLVAPGVYYENLDLHRTLLTLVSERGADVTVIDGKSVSAPVIAGVLSGRVEGFTIRNGRGTFGGGVEMSYGGNATIHNNIFTANSGLGSAIGGNGASPTVEANEFYANGCGDGVISFVNESSPWIVDNVIHDNACVAINFTLPDATYSAPTVSNNTIVRNSIGIYIDHRVSNEYQSYYNNIIANNELGLEVVNGSGGTDAVWRNNLVFGNGTQFSGTPDPTGGSGNLNTDPLFLDSANSYFELSPFSPAIDAGTSTGVSLPALDFTDSPRVVAGHQGGPAIVDIGAYEEPTGPDYLFADGFE